MGPTNDIKVELHQRKPVFEIRGKSKFDSNNDYRETPRKASYTQGSFGR
jgi:hypothetical protein